MAAVAITYRGHLRLALLCVGLAALPHSLAATESDEYAASKQSIDSFIVAANYRAYEADGKLGTEATTPAAQHEDVSNHSLITAPDILLNTATSGQWHITAQQALAKDTEHLVFYGNVQLKQISTDHTKDKTIETPRLNFSIQSHIASTTAPVTITQPGTHINAQGMRADLNSGIITLIQHPQGTYEPSQKQHKKATKPFSRS